MKGCRLATGTHRRFRCLAQPKPIQFPTSTEDFLGETKRHLDNRTALYLTLKDLFAASATIGSEQFVYYHPQEKRRCLCPDVMIKLGVPDTPFDVWNTYETGPLDLGVEIVSKADQHDLDWHEKLERYRLSAVREVVRFDWEKAAHPIRVWDRQGDDLVERADDDPDLRYCRALGLWWFVTKERGIRTLRLARDRDGAQLLSTPSEARQKAEKARRKAERALRKAEKERDAMAAELAKLKARLAKPRRTK